MVRDARGDEVAHERNLEAAPERGVINRAD